MDIRCQIRPFLKNAPQAAYELVLIRSDGDRLVVCPLAILSGTDARDLHSCCPSFEFISSS